MITGCTLDWELCRTSTLESFGGTLELNSIISRIDEGGFVQEQLVAEIEFRFRVKKPVNLSALNLLAFSLDMFPG